MPPDSHDTPSHRRLSARMTILLMVVGLGIGLALTRSLIGLLVTGPLIVWMGADWRRDPADVIRTVRDWVVLGLILATPLAGPINQALDGISDIGPTVAHEVDQGRREIGIEVPEDIAP